MLFLPLLLVTLLASSLANALSKTERTPVPSEHYIARDIAGWTVRVNRELLETRQEVGQRALKLLELKLKELISIVPAEALQTLQTVPIWLGVDDYEKPNAVYHPSAGWLKEHGFNPEKARAVEIPNAAVFIEWSDNQPMIVLHELAHAYHHQLLGHGHTELNLAFNKAKSSGRYTKVRHVQGFTKEAYGMNNVQEFFAEMSEAYFGRNDFFPFTREDLERYDPQTYSLIEVLWHKPREAVREH